MTSRHHFCSEIDKTTTVMWLLWGLSRNWRIRFVSDQVYCAYLAEKASGFWKLVHVLKLSLFRAGIRGRLTDHCLIGERKKNDAKRNFVYTNICKFSHLCLHKTALHLRLLIESASNRWHHSKTLQKEHLNVKTMLEQQHCNKIIVMANTATTTLSKIIVLFASL